eukprot:gb/GECG01012248.1/.p1 GENE.gb/GECG01012248.1/~~gb/GECG01012248.1/.p1  ORF type:complete len:645 (+),score=61.19 gb/GECG01012248.1/:1-1935(+)
MQRLAIVVALVGAVGLSEPAVGADVYSRNTLRATNTEDTHDYLIKFGKGYTEEDFQSFFYQLSRYCEDNDCSVTVKQRFHRLLEGAVLNLSPERHLLQWIRKRAEVERFEADSKVSLAATSTRNVTTDSTEYWNLDRIDQRTDAELDGHYSYTYTGEGINAYIIDSGIRLTHNEFDGNRIRLVDFIEDGNDDCNGHGTHVAGTVGGKTYGVAKEVNLVAVRVFGCEGETTLTILLEGLIWAFEDFSDSEASTAVINLSLSSSASPLLDDAIDALNDTGLVVVSAAGNSDADACLFSPARSSSSITVGATSEGDARASFSNHGSCVNIFAPGEEIYSAWYTSDSAKASISGTSMSAPVVAGIIARYLEQHSEAPPSEAASSLLCGATPGVVSNMPDDNGLTVNLLAYGDPEGVETVEIGSTCPAGSNAVCAGSTPCSGSGDCFNSGRCVCDCGSLGQACQFAADIEEIGTVGESTVQLKRSTHDSPPIFVGSAGTKVFSLETSENATTITISSCSSKTGFATIIGLVDGCLNNLLFDGEIDFPWSTDHPDCEVSTGGAYLKTVVNGGDQYYILVTGQDRDAEGDFELFVRINDEDENDTSRFPGDGGKASCSERVRSSSAFTLVSAVLSLLATSHFRRTVLLIIA